MCVCVVRLIIILCLTCAARDDLMIAASKSAAGAAAALPALAVLECVARDTARETGRALQAGFARLLAF